MVNLRTILKKAKRRGGFLLGLSIVFMCLRLCQVMLYESSIGLCQDEILVSASSPNEDTLQIIQSGNHIVGQINTMIK